MPLSTVEPRHLLVIPPYAFSCYTTVLVPLFVGGKLQQERDM